MDYFTHPNVWLTAVEIGVESQVFPKLSLSTNQSRIVVNTQIDMLLVEKLGTAITSRERR